jgi:hypothetical protein
VVKRKAKRDEHTKGARMLLSAAEGTAEAAAERQQSSS